MEKRLTYTWCFVGYEGVSYLSFELFELGENTRLILTHSGLDTFPSENPDFAFDKFVEGWNYIVNTSLKNFLEN